MRRLVFEPNDHQKRFVLCYQSLCFAEAPLPRNELRPHGDLLRKLEGVGQVANPNRAETDVTLYRCIGGGEVIVTEVEYRILKRFLNSFVDKVSRVLSREMDATLEWIDNVSELPEPKAAVENSAPV